VKHLLILLISILLLSSPVIGDKHKWETLYLGGTSYFDSEWNEIGDKKIHPVYKGYTKNGLPNGQGTLTKPNGDKYVGEWKYGFPNGQGTMIWHDLVKYVGEFKNGKRNGQGTFTLPDGRKYVGEYKDGKTWNGTVYDKNGIIIGKWVNGKYI